MSLRACARSAGDFGSFVSPLAVRVWFTVAAAMRSAVSSDRPRSFSLSLTCSYCRSRLGLQACLGIDAPPDHRRGEPPHPPRYEQVACALRNETVGGQIGEVADALDDDVGRGAVGRLAGVVALEDVNGRHAAVAPARPLGPGHRLLVEHRAMARRGAGGPLILPPLRFF